MSFKNYINQQQNIHLSASQAHAVNKIDEFLNSPAYQTFIFKGAAGSGKTFLSALLREYLPNRTYIYTPTGRAAKVIKSMIADKHKRNNVSTIHKGIYTWERDETEYSRDLPNVPENVSKITRFYKLAQNKDQYNTVYICDESSMISNRKAKSPSIVFGSGFLLKDIFQFIGQRKIIFVGDNAQLAPINMESSPALDKKYLEETFGLKVIEIELTEIMRQKKHSGILKNASEIRNSIKQRQYTKISLPLHDDVKKIGSVEAINLCAEHFNPTRFENCMMITHTRKLSHEYNTKIRNKIFPQVQTNNEFFTVGDRLVCARNNYLYELFNGELLKVNKVFSGENNVTKKVIKLFPSEREKEAYKKELEADGRIHVELVYRKAELEYYDAYGNTSIIECLLLENSVQTDDLALPEIEERALYVEFKMRHNIEINKYKVENNREHLSSEEIRLAIENGEIATNPTTDPFLNAIISKYGYSLTTHKSQGGEWKRAMVDFDTKFWNKENEQFFRWCYTGITRAKDELFIVNGN